MCTDNYIKSIDVYSEVKVLVSDLATPWTVACEAPRSMGFSRQEYWRGLPFPASGRLPSPGDQTQSSYVSCTDRWVLYHGAWEAQQWADLVPRSWILMPFVHKRNQGSLEKWLILGLGQEILQMSFHHLALPESNKQKHTNGGVSECQGSQLKKRPVAEWVIAE